MQHSPRVQSILDRLDDPTEPEFINLTVEAQTFSIQELEELALALAERDEATRSAQ